MFSLRCTKGNIFHDSMIPYFSVVALIQMESTQKGKNFLLMEKFISINLFALRFTILTFLSAKRLRVDPHEKERQQMKMAELLFLKIYPFSLT